MRAGSKDSFIPYNSAVVVTVNVGAELAPEIRQAFAADLKVFRRKLLVRITDTLQQQGLVKAHPYVVAARVEGKSDVAFLYVMDNKDVISRGEVTDFLNRTNLRNDLEVFTFKEDSRSFGAGGIKIKNVCFTDEKNKPVNWIVGGEIVKLHVECLAKQDIHSPIVGFYVNDKRAGKSRPTVT